MSVSVERSPDSAWNVSQMSVAVESSPDSALNVSVEIVPEVKPAPPQTCRERLAIFMRSNHFQYAIIIMVIMDSMIVVMELLVENVIIHDDREDDVETVGNSSAQASRLRRDQTKSQPMEEVDSEQQTLLTAKNQLGQILHLCSLAVVSLFLIEISCKIFAEGKNILNQKGEMFDIVVVVLTFSIDLLFTFKDIDPATQDITGMIILLRLWRVTHLVNGLIVNVKVDMEKNLKAENRLRMQAEKQVDKLLIKMKKIKQDNTEMKTELGMPLSQPKTKLTSRPVHKQSTVDSSTFTDPSSQADGSSLWSAPSTENPDSSISSVALTAPAPKGKP